MASKRFTLARMERGGTAYAGGRQYSIDRGLQRESVVLDGNRYEQGHLVTRIAPAIEITSLNLGDIFDSGVWGASSDLPIVIPGAPGLVLYGAQLDESIPGLESSGHLKHTMANAVMRLRRLSWSKGGLAEATIGVLAYGANSGTDPVVEATSASVPAAGSTAYGWVCSAVTVAGTQIPVRSVELTIEDALELTWSEGGPAPTGVVGQGPLVVSASIDTELATAAGGTGTTTIVLKPLAHGGGYGATTLTITLNGDYAFIDSVGGDLAGVTKRLTVTTRHDGTNRPMTWAIA